ncbi:hypothetical protein PRZ48_006165 [Zasmidium cellare]|uniref:Major facilitator superfamily (MFS) profile domain-containing protein n=1 Tax=Zasmidium cellare TaxID=395010 RepID=A0ABR0EN01_ZASCE|nr:hypothetical protein PRZ48_006165 [Zasmidium cellare]
MTLLKYYFRETFAGRLINILSGDRLLKAPQPLIPPRQSNITLANGDIATGTPARAESELKESGMNSRGSLDSRTYVEDVPISQLANRLSSQVESQEKGIGDGIPMPTQEQEEVDKYLVGWNGDDDAENPRNWPMWLKVWSTCMISLLTFSIYIGSAIYTTGIEQINEQFHVSRVVSTLGLSLFVLGYGMARPHDPRSALRNAPYRPHARLCYHAATLRRAPIPLVYAPNIGTILAFRFITGFIGSPVLATGAASLADIFSPKKLPYAVGIWGNFGLCGPVLGPLVSGFAVMNKGWKWSIWILIWLNGLCAVFMILAMPETSADNVLYRRAKRLRRVTGEERYKSAGEIAMAHFSVKEVAVALLVKPFWLCFVSEPILLVQNAYLGLIYALLYCWFDAFPLVFIGMHGFNLGQMGLSYIGILAGSIICTPPYFYWIRKVIEPQSRPDGTIEPEKRLPAAIVGSFFIPICLFWFGWSARPDVHWIMPIIGSSFFVMGANPLFNSLINYQADAYPKVVGSVMAGNDLIRSSMGAGFPLFATQCPRN